MEKMTDETEFLMEVEIEAAEKSHVPWNMLERNQIPGFLPFQYYYKDNSVCFRYITDGLQPAAKYFESKKGDFDTLFFLCSGIVRIVERGEEYLLNEKEYYLAPDRVYWNRWEKRIALCYLPGKIGRASCRGRV